MERKLVSDWQSELEEIEANQKTTLERMKAEKEAKELAQRRREADAMKVLESVIVNACAQLGEQLAKGGTDVNTSVGKFGDGHRARMTLTLPSKQVYTILLRLETELRDSLATLTVGNSQSSQIHRETLKTPWSDVAQDEVASALVRGYKQALLHHNSHGEWGRP